MNPRLAASASYLRWRYSEAGEGFAVVGRCGSFSCSLQEAKLYLCTCLFSVRKGITSNHCLHIDAGYKCVNGEKVLLSLHGSAEGVLCQYHFPLPVNVSFNCRAFAEKKLEALHTPVASVLTKSSLTWHLMYLRKLQRCIEAKIRFAEACLFVTFAWLTAISYTPIC